MKTIAWIVCLGSTAALGCGDSSSDEIAGASSWVASTGIDDAPSGSADGSMDTGADDWSPIGDSSTEAGSSGDFGSPDDGASDDGTGTGIEPGGNGPELGALAHGISVTVVEANPGVPQAIWDHGHTLTWEEVTVFYPRDRPTLIRAHWAVDPGWVSKSIEARLILGRDGEYVELVDQRVVDASSVDDVLDTTFHWEVEADWATPQTIMRVELWDPELVAGTPAPAQPPVAPAVDQFMSGQWHDTDHTLKVVLVPIDRNLPGCPGAPSPTGAELDDVRADLMANFGVNDVVLQVDPPIEYNGNLVETFDHVLSHISWLRSSQYTDPAAFYYGLIDPCGGVAHGGLGYLGGWPSQDNAWKRSAVGVWYPGNVVSSVSTMVHEIGHNFGRNHVYCNGQEDDPDWAYPYEGGSIGNAGWDIANGLLRPSIATHDTMSYCWPRFVSDYGWMQSYWALGEMTSWGWTKAAPPSQGEGLGSVLVGSGDDWMVVPGSVTDAELDGSVRLTFRTGRGRVDQAAVRVALPDSGGEVLAAPVPVALSSITGIDLDDAGVQREVVLATVRGLRTP